MPMAISRPKATLNIIPASQLATVEEQKALIVCQMLPAGTAVSEALIQNHPNDSSEDALLGQTSMGAGMVREFKKLNKITRLDILPIDDASGTQGTAVFTITGPATEDGTLNFIAASEENFNFEVDILDEDTETEIGDALVALINANADCPYTAANVTGTVTLTADQDGTLCNNWDIKVIGSVAGVGVALTGWTGGATDPTLTTLLDAIANIRYQTIIWPEVFTLTLLETVLDARFNVNNNVMDGIGIQTLKDTLANLQIATASLNSQSLCVIGNKLVNKTTHIGGATPEMPDIISAQVGAIRALRLTEEANLTQFLTTVAPDDQFGGVHIASLPYFNTLLPNLPIANAVDFFDQDDQDTLEDNAVSLIGPNRAFNGTIMGPMVTTYLTDNGGNPDTSYKYVNSVDTISAMREFFVVNYRSRYAQTRLTDGDLIANKDMANEGSIRAFSGELYDQLAEEGLAQAGRVAKKDFMDNLIVVVSISAGTATITAAPLMVTQLRAILGTIQVNFSS
jgi:phage tail sheath gpL-like